MSASPGLTQADLERLLPVVLDDVVAVLDSADLGAPVAACPDWRVIDLVDHLGGIHQWAAAAVRAADPDAGAPTLAREPAPSDARERVALLTWTARHGADLLAALQEAGPDRPAWGFGPRPRTSGFWWRRMVHETTLHSWDVRAAQRSGAPWTISEDPALALDGIDEVVGTLFPRQVRVGRCDPLPATVRVRPTEDPDGPGWLLAGDGTGDPRDPDLAVDAVLHGPADALLLALWRRAAPDDERLRVEGEAALVADVLGRRLVP